MIQGIEDATFDFQYLNRHSARNILIQDIQDKEVCDKIVELIPQEDDRYPKTLTGFQLKDIIDESFNLDDLKKGITARIELNNDKDVYKRDPRIIADKALEDHQNFEEETEEERNKRWGNPKTTFKEILEEFGLVEETKDKLKEIDFTEDIFWYADVNELIGLLELKDFSKEKKLPKRIQQIKENHLKLMQKQDDENKRLSKEKQD